MKRLCFGKKVARKGVASLYVVVFATVLFGVITIGFTRIVVSDAIQSANDDLSRSAYDAAMAGVEDAKRFVAEYYDCLANKDCSVNPQQENVFKEKKCNGMFSYLYNSPGLTEVNVQEGSGSSVNDYDEAYTCVIVTDETPDYRGTLTSDTPVRAIPILIDGGVNHVAPGVSPNKIVFSWHSTSAQGKTNFNYIRNDGLFETKDRAPNPPVVQLTLIATKGTYDLDPSNFNRPTSTGDVIYSTMVLVPSGGATYDNKIDINSLRNYDNAAVENPPIKVSCSTTTEFACSFSLDYSGFGNTKNLAIIASLPYNDAYTDFAVTLYKVAGGNETSIPLTGAQVSIDSTGRANDLFRRVETRLEFTDLYFPFPQYALELTGGSDDTFKKNFWVTANCWTEKGICNNNNM